MQVQNYIFQSPSPNPVQVGRPDTSVSKEDTSSQTRSETSTESSNATNELKTQKIEQPSANNILDLYV